jgi:Mce-associated membrane protein
VSDAVPDPSTTSEESPERAPTSWRIVNLVLIGVAFLLVVALGLVAVQAFRGDPAQARAEKTSHQFKAISKAARAETQAFLNVDYTNMDPLMAKVLAGATGSFKQQYAGARANLKASATTALARSTGKVRSVGVGDLTPKTAVVFVAADSQVTNKSTAGKAQPRYYRLKLTMVKQGDAWLTSDLQFVG